MTFFFFFFLPSVSKNNEEKMESNREACLFSHGLL